MTVPELPLAVEYTWSLNVPALLAVTLAGGAYAWRLRDLRRTPGAAQRRHAHARHAARARVRGRAGGDPDRARLPDRPTSARTACSRRTWSSTCCSPTSRRSCCWSASAAPSCARRCAACDRSRSGSARSPIPRRRSSLYVGLMWLWHVPAMYELALDHAWAHALEHASFFTAGMAFWWYLIEPVPPRHRLTGPWALGVPRDREAPDGGARASCSRSHPTRCTRPTRTRRAPGA